MCKSVGARERICSILTAWNSQSEVVELVSQDLDNAVAKGAAYYGRAKETGEGVRIVAGCARSYYLGLKAQRMAIPGMPAKTNGLCVLAQGSQEGETFTIEDRQFGLVTGSRVSFQFFSASTRSGDVLGSLVEGAQSSWMN